MIYNYGGLDTPGVELKCGQPAQKFDKKKKGLYNSKIKLCPERRENMTSQEVRGGQTLPIPEGGLKVGDLISLVEHKKVTSIFGGVSEEVCLSRVGRVEEVSVPWITGKCNSCFYPFSLPKFK